MKTLSQRYGEWVTGLRSDVFKWARIRLTALYLLIIILILGVYSLVMFFSVLKGVHVDSAIDEVQFRIFMIDVAIFIVAAFGSYWLAGITLKPIKKSLDAQEAFSSDASHELRTPLAVMKTSIEVVLRGDTPVPDEMRRLLLSNLEEIQKLTSLTTDLLDIARGREKAPQGMSVGTIVRDEAAILKTLAEQKRIGMRVTGEVQNTVLGDEGAIRRVFRNIIANAIAYTPAEGSITISMRDAGREVIVSITDTGIGMSEHDLANIFKHFYRADSSHVVQGSGLGLALVKRIVEYHKGTIAIDSVLHKGTTVTITLPAA